jgi:hypothetical protein
VKPPPDFGQDEGAAFSQNHFACRIGKIERQGSFEGKNTIRTFQTGHRILVQYLLAVPVKTGRVHKHIMKHTGRYRETVEQVSTPVTAVSTGIPHLLGLASVQV